MAARPATAAGLVYLDTSAVVKLVRSERHSVDLTRWLSGLDPARAVSSVLLEVELARAVRRAAPDRLDRVPAVLAEVDLVALSGQIMRSAAGHPDPLLRSLDAIHVATAEVVAAADPGFRGFVSYDVRLLDAAVGLGVPVAAPGLR